MQFAAFAVVLWAQSFNQPSIGSPGYSAGVMACTAAALPVRSYVRAIDETATARWGELLERSRIVQDMLGYLNTARVTLTLARNDTLIRDRRAGGLSRFLVANGVLAGRIEFDGALRDAAAQRKVLAHELAHAVEIAALPRRTTSALGNQLLAQIGRHDLWSSSLIIETPFAQRVGELVAGELKHGVAPAGTLSSLAQRYRVNLGGCSSHGDRADAEQ